MLQFLFWWVSFKRFSTAEKKWFYLLFSGQLPTKSCLKILSWRPNKKIFLSTWKSIIFEYISALFPAVRWFEIFYVDFFSWQCIIWFWFCNKEICISWFFFFIWNLKSCAQKNILLFQCYNFFFFCSQDRTSHVTLRSNLGKLLNIFGGGM